MNGIFNVDNVFFRTISKMLETLLLALLFLLFSLPIFTAGAANTALYYVVNKTIKHDRGYIRAGFFSAFMSNFKQATIIWLIFLGIYTLLGIDCYAIKLAEQLGEANEKQYIIFFVFMVITTMWSIYVFPYIARFENSTKDVLKNTAIIAFSNAPSTIFLTVLLLGCWIVVYKFTPLIIVLPVLYNLIKNFVLERIFKKYMTEEQLSNEEELNRVYYN